MRERWLNHIDWMLIVLYVILTVLGWISIYSACYRGGSVGISWNSNEGRQLIWLAASLPVLTCVLWLDGRTYQALAYVFYALSVLMLGSTLLWGIGKAGHRAWLAWGGQPGELAKCTCALAIAKCLDAPRKPSAQLHSHAALIFLIALPMGVVLLQGDAGSALVFFAFVLVLYREGLSVGWLCVAAGLVMVFVLGLLVAHTYLIVGMISVGLLVAGVYRKSWKKLILIGCVTFTALLWLRGTHTLVHRVLKPHQQNRIKALVDPNIDPLGIGWNVTQSKIAIGSGGLWGKGFLQGTQSRYGFVPERSTDFIFCTIGEEHGWIGSTLLVTCFVVFLLRMLHVAERQRTRFARAYGYSVASLFFFHFAINIGMTIGLVPVIGIPLPLVSYGGSSLWSFSAMVFILVRLDAERHTYHHRHLRAQTLLDQTP